MVPSFYSSVSNFTEVYPIMVVDDEYCLYLCRFVGFRGVSATPTSQISCHLLCTKSNSHLLCSLQLMLLLMPNKPIHAVVRASVMGQGLNKGPGSSEIPRNPLTRWDVSSTPANGIFLTKNLKKKKKNAQRWRTIKKPLVHKIRLYGRRGKGTAESFSREKVRHALQKEGG